MKNILTSIWAIRIARSSSPGKSAKKPIPNQRTIHIIAERIPILSRFKRTAVRHIDNEAIIEIIMVIVVIFTFQIHPIKLKAEQLPQVLRLQCRIFRKSYPLLFE